MTTVITPKTIVYACNEKPRTFLVRDLSGSRVAVLDKKLPIYVKAPEGIKVVLVGLSGIPGSPGIAEDAVPYAKRTDVVSDSLIYIGEAIPGTAESSPQWRISRLTFAVDGDVTTQWAGGTALFDKVWADRAQLEYL